MAHREVAEPPATGPKGLGLGILTLLMFKVLGQAAGLLLDEHHADQHVLLVLVLDPHTQQLLHVLHHQTAAAHPPGGHLQTR